MRQCTSCLQGLPALDPKTSALTFNVSIISDPAYLKFSDGVARMTYNKQVTPNSFAKVMRLTCDHIEPLGKQRSVYANMLTSRWYSLCVHKFLLTSFRCRRGQLGCHRQCRHSVSALSLAALVAYLIKAMLTKLCFRMWMQAVTVTAQVNPGATLTGAALFLDVDQTVIVPASAPVPAPAISAGGITNNNNNIGYGNNNNNNNNGGGGSITNNNDNTGGLNNNNSNGGNNNNNNGGITNNNNNGGNNNNNNNGGGFTNNNNNGAGFTTTNNNGFGAGALCFLLRRPAIAL